MDMDSYYKSRPEFVPVGQLHQYAPAVDAGPAPTSYYAVHYCRVPGLVETQLLLTRSMAESFVRETRRRWCVDDPRLLYAPVAAVPDDVQRRLLARMRWRMRITTLLRPIGLAWVLPWAR